MRPQFRRRMPATVVAGEPNAAHHVRLEEAQPVGVADLLEWLRLEDAEVVDEHVDLRESLDGARAAFRARKIGRPALDSCARQLGAQPLHGRVDTRARAPVHDHPRAFACERTRDGESDAGRRARHERLFRRQSQVHCASRLQVGFVVMALSLTIP